jgi:hypothetical protein
MHATNIGNAMFTRSIDDSDSCDISTCATARPTLEPTTNELPKTLNNNETKLRLVTDTSSLVEAGQQHPFDIRRANPDVQEYGTQKSRRN